MTITETEEQVVKRLMGVQRRQQHEVTMPQLLGEAYRSGVRSAQAQAVCAECEEPLTSTPCSCCGAKFTLLPAEQPEAEEEERSDR